MIRRLRLLYGCLLATVACSIAQAQTRTAKLNTTKAQIGAGGV